MNDNYMAPLKTEYRKLIQEEKNGNIAKLINEFVTRFCDKTIEDCKEKFCYLSTNNYKPIDTDEIFMLQLNIAVAKDIKTFVETEMINGDNASASLAEVRRS